MSETEIGNMELVPALPPAGQLPPSSEGLTAWRPVYDFILVRDLPQGRKLLKLRKGGESEVAFELSAGEAAEIGRRLMEPSASPRPAVMPQETKGKSQ